MSHSPDLLYLAACALNGRTPSQERLAQMDFTLLYNEAKKQSIRSCIAKCLTDSDILALMPPETAKKWTDCRFAAMRKDLLFNAERSAICGFMEQEKIWYLPLKGILLKELYPECSMREMTDNDILIDAEKADVMQNFMLARGYQTGSEFGEGAHEEYFKPPFLNFELHRTLFDSENTPEVISYYQNITTHLLETAGSCCRRFTEEDFYLFFLSHAHKHHYGEGSGLRNLLDEYVYLSKKQGELDWDYLNRLLKQLNLTEFEALYRSLAFKLLFDPETPQSLTAAEQDMLDTMTHAGTYGSVESNVRMRVQRDLGGSTSKFRYYWRRLFPDRNWYRINQPFYDKHPYLIPFFTVYRLTFGLLTGRKRIREEMEVLRRLDIAEDSSKK